MATSYTSVSVEDIDSDFDLCLYPNPASDLIRIQTSSEITSVSLFNIQGQLLTNVNVNCESYEFDLNQFAKGTYIIRITEGNKTYSRQIVKK